MSLHSVEPATGRDLHNPAVVEATERAAALRWSLDRQPESAVADAVATRGTPGVREGRPVEVKAARCWVSNGDHRTRGRFALSRSTHRNLASQGGYYAALAYRLVGDGDGEPALLLVGADLVPATAATAAINAVESVPARVRWDRLVSLPDGVAERGAEAARDGRAGEAPPRHVLAEHGAPFGVSDERRVEETPAPPAATDGGEQP
jgi:hypothetical protein